MLLLSDEFKQKLKDSEVPAKSWALRARHSPPLFYRQLQGISPLRRMDSKILLIARWLGVPREKVFIDIGNEPPEEFEEDLW